MARVVKNVIDDIINRSKTEGVTVDELLNLFAEAYSLVSSEDSVGKSQIQQIEAQIKNVIKDREDLFGGEKNEHRDSLYQMRDNKGRSPQSDDVVVTVETENTMSDEEKKNKLKEFAKHKNNLKGGTDFVFLVMKESDYEKAATLWDVDQSVLDDMINPSDENKKAQYQAKYGLMYADIAELVSEYRKYQASPQEYDKTYARTDGTEGSVVSEPEETGITLRQVYEEKDVYLVGEKTFKKYSELLSEEDYKKAEELLATNPSISDLVTMEYGTSGDEKIAEYKEKYGENYANIARLVSTYMTLKDTENSKEKDNDKDHDSKFEDLKDEIRSYTSSWKAVNSDIGVIDGNTFTGEEIEAVATLYSTKGIEFIEDALSRAKKGEEIEELKGYSEESVIRILTLANSFTYHKESQEKDDIPVVTPVVLSNEDQEILNTLGSLEELGKLDFLSNKIDQKTARDAIDSNKPNEALANVEDLLMAHYYFGRDIENFAQKDVDVLDSVTKEQLQAILSDPSHITPSNAAAYRLLCEKCGDSTLKSQVLEAIAKSLKEYDNDRFGPNPDPQKFNDDYVKLQLRVKNIDPLEFKAEENEPSLKDTIIIGEDGKPLSDEEAEEQKKALAELAKEIAIQNLLKKGNDNIDDDALKSEIKDVTNRILLGSGGKVQGGKFVTTIQSLSTSVALIQNEATTFKDRVLQKFKDSDFGKKVHAKVSALDKRLEEKFGEHYKTAKSYAKAAGKFAVGTIKSSIMFAAAGLVPGGTAVLMGYNIYKSWKGIAPELKKKDVSLAKKAALVLGTAVTSTISMAAMAVGLDAGAENLAGVSEGLSGMMDFIIAARTKRNCALSSGVLPGSSRFSPSSVERDQLLCLPEPFTPAKGFSCNKTWK